MFTPIDTFLQGKTVFESGANNYNDALLVLVTSGANIVTYEARREFMVNNINVFERVADNKVKYEVLLRDGDLISDLQSNVPIIVTVGHLEARPEDKIVIVAAQYAVIKVTFFLDPEHFPETFTLSYKVFLLGSELRHQVAGCSVSSGSLGYVNGSAVRL